MQAAKLAPMHVDTQGADVVLAACRNALLKKYLGSQGDMEEGHALFHMCNSLVLSKGLLYMMQATRVSKEHWLWHRNIFGGR